MRKWLLTFTQRTLQYYASGTIGLKKITQSRAFFYNAPYAQESRGIRMMTNFKTFHSVRDSRIGLQVTRSVMKSVGGN